MRRHLRVLVVLGLTQITGWGMVGILPVIAPRVAAAFGVSLSSVFLGTSVMFVAMGLAAPWAGRVFRRFGSREAMTGGAATIGLGLCLLALSPNATVFLAAWGIIGLAGALFLTTAAYAYIASYADEQARSLIGTLMLVTGLAGSVFWPVTAFLESQLGWRGVGLAYGAVMASVVCPLVWLGLPAIGETAAPALGGGRLRKGRVFVLMAAAIALNGFVTFGIDSVGIQLLDAMGMDLAGAVAIASLLGVFKVGGRGIELLGGWRWDALSTGLVAGAMIPMGLAAIWIGGSGSMSIGGYLVLFGLGSGAFAVARATMPLVFFQKADYVAAMSTIALSLNLINALAPPVLAGLMSGLGPQAMFAVLARLSATALAILLLLSRMKSASQSSDGNRAV